MTSLKSNNSELENTLVTIISDVLGVSSATIHQKATRESHSKWDSMKHIELVIAIETEFGFRFKGDEVGKMNSLEQIKSLVQTKLASAQ